MSVGLAGIVLAAGLGTRLQPLTTLRPKALCPVGATTLLDDALDRLASVGLAGADDVAVNAHHLADQVVAAVGSRATVSVEHPQALGTAGALARLGPWRAGRALVVTNADAYLHGQVDALLAGWDGDTVRLLVVPVERDGDFGSLRFAGCSLLPDRVLRHLRPEPGGLYETVWRVELERGTAELVELAGTFIDCGTPADYLAANLHRSGGTSVVGTGAVVEGEVVRSVVWPGARVEAGERLVEQIRAGSLTVRTNGT